MRRNPTLFQTEIPLELRNLCLSHETALHRSSKCLSLGKTHTTSFSIGGIMSEVTSFHYFRSWLFRSILLYWHPCNYLGVNYSVTHRWDVTLLNAARYYFP